MNTILFNFIFKTFKECFDFINPHLGNQQEFSKKLSNVSKVKVGGNVQFNFDNRLDEIIKTRIGKHDISGKIFSEETGFFDVPGEKYRLVYDPFCNSSLASRTFREAALGLSIFNYDYSYVTSAVMDYQTGIVGLVEGETSKFYQIQTGDELKFNNAIPKSLDEAWMVFTLERTRDRQHMHRAEKLLQKAGRLHVGSGHIYWLKLAAGFIDIYLDPFGGEKLYEMFACGLAQKAGCIVTDLDGKNFDASGMLEEFEKDQDFVFHPVASRSEALHEQVLKSIV